MGHSYLQLICNGRHPWVVLHLENRLVAYQIKIACKMKPYHMLNKIQQWKPSEYILYAKIKVADFQLA
jgi:hypothetical protein